MLTITGLAIGIVVGLLVLAALAPEALTPRWARTICRLVVEYLRAQMQADRSTNWGMGELASALPVDQPQRTVPLADILGTYAPLAYAPGAHRLGGHHERAMFGTVTGSYAQVARWSQDTQALPRITDEMLAGAGAR